MATLGVRASIDWALPTGIDADTIVQWSLRSGLTPSEVITMAAGTIGAVNSELAERYGAITSFTEELFAYDRQGASSRTMTPLRSEFSAADAIRSDQIGRMLPIFDYEDAVGWTALYLRDAYRRQLEFDLEEIGDRWRNRVEFDLWTRLLTNTENLVGSAGYDVPFAIGTGTNVDYIPPQFDSYVFDATHSHFNWHNDTTDDWDDAIEAAMVDLRHHGLGGRLTLFIGDNDLTEVTALTNFVETVPTDLQVNSVSGAPVYQVTDELTGLPGERVGYYHSTSWGIAEVRRIPRIPSNYGFMTRAFGQGSGSNALAVREHPEAGFGLRTEVEVKSTLNPRLERVFFEATHGVTVNNRLNGVGIYIAAGAAAWVNPTIS